MVRGVLGARRGQRVRRGLRGGPVAGCRRPPRRAGPGGEAVGEPRVRRPPGALACAGGGAGRPPRRGGSVVGMTAWAGEMGDGVELVHHAPYNWRGHTVHRAAVPGATGSAAATRDVTCLTRF